MLTTILTEMKTIFGKETNRIEAVRLSRMKGFSLIEVIIVLVIIAILTAISLPYIYNYRTLYRSEDQALKVMDLMREANQLALTRRRTMRFEIDLTDNRALIIDEDTRTTPAVHREVKALLLDDVSDVRIDQIPTGISKPSPPAYNDAAFAADTTGHQSGGTTVSGNNVWAIRFKRDGSVVNAADTPVSANLYVWTPLTAGSAAPRNKEEVRAITVFGGSGAIRYWKHDGTTFLPY